MANLEGGVVTLKPDWDPLVDEDSSVLSSVATNRIRRDLISLFSDPPPGVFVVGDEENIRMVHVLIIGPSGTPYEGGLFYFFLKCPPNYPMQPPKMKLMTTDGGRVRFNPNFYDCGKICVSILGTWPGPSWSPISNLSSLFVTIQSLMVENPLQNEPGLHNCGAYFKLDSEIYNEYIKHETLRVAVCGMVENECALNMPQQLKEIIDESFLNYYDHYLDVATQSQCKNGTTVKIPHFGNTHTFHYDKILERLQKLRDKLTAT